MLRRNYAEITQKLRRNYAEITQKLRRNYAEITQITQITHSENNYAKITQKLRNVLGTRHFTRITQKLRKLRKNYANYASAKKLRRLRTPHFADGPGPRGARAGHWHGHGRSLRCWPPGPESESDSKPAAHINAFYMIPGRFFGHNIPASGS